jgi:argininosuccinate lyase
VSRAVPEGYLGANARIRSGPAPELVDAGYQLEIGDAALLHRGLGLADLAHLLELAETGVVPTDDAGILLATLLEWLDAPADSIPYDAMYGDAYNSRERELERRHGSVAGWLHTGRTRREAGRIAFRLVLRERLLLLHAAVDRLAGALGEQAERHADTVWADSTYLQPAQPSTFGHYLGAFSEETIRHLDRVEAVYAWANQSPAGSGGVGGTRVPLDRERLAWRLGFAAPGRQTRDAMWATDGLADAVFTAAQAATTASRLAEDLEIFASPGFGYVALDASLCRASVLMPQKRNPYALAVIRSGAGTLIGRATGALVTQRTPSARTDNWLHAYGEVAESLELSRRIVALGAEVTATLEVDRQAMAAAAGTHFTGAADLAEDLVLRAGLDYRSAYRVVGTAVADAIESGRPTIAGDDLARAAVDVLGRSIDVEADLVSGALDPAEIVATRTAPGGAAPQRVREHSAAIRERLDLATSWRNARLDGNGASEKSLIAAAKTVAEKNSR